MKTLLVAIFCFAVFHSFAQNSEAIVEEKSSAWIRVAEDPVAVQKPAKVKKHTTAVKKKKPAGTPPSQNQNAQDEFEKTNSQVNRFKKQQKG